MDVRLVLIISISLQISTLVLAVRLIRVSGYYRAWLLISLAVLLMAVRRVVVLHQILAGRDDGAAELPGETIGLFISLFMLLGVANIAPLLRAHRRARETLERWVSERTASLIATNQALEAEIRQRQQAEEALRQAYDLLELRVIERTAELRASEAKLRAILNSTPEGFVLLDQQFFIQAFTARMSQITQRITGRELVEGNSMLDWVLAPQRESFHSHFEQALAGQPVVIEWQHTPAAGETHWYELSYLPVRLNDSQSDEVIGVCFSSLDITERKRAEDARRLAEKKYRDIFENGVIGIFQSRENRFLAVNPALASMLGYDSPQEVVEQITDISAQIYADPARRDEVVRQMTQGLGPYTFEIAYRRRDGREWIGRLNARAVRDEAGNVQYFEGFVEDITDLKRAEAALHDSKARLESIFRAAPVGIGLVSNRVLVEVNHTLCAITGYTAEELIGQSARILYPTDEDFEYVGRAKYAQIARYGTGTVETRFRCKDGTIRDILLSSTPLDPNNLPAGVSFTALDITERQQAEAALRRHDAILEAVTFAADQFLRVPEWRQSIQLVLDELGRAIKADRVYIFENETGPGEDLLMSQRYEWCAPGVAAQIDNPVLQRLPWQAGGFARWQHTLSQGRPIYGAVRDFPPSEQAILEPQGIRSIAVVPIFAGSSWWGFIGFDDCTAERAWSEMEIDALKVAASMLGAAIERQNIERALRASEATQRAILATIPDLLFRVDRQGMFLGLHISDPNLLFAPGPEVLGRTLHHMLPPDVSEQAEYHLARAFETGRVETFEYTLNLPSGQRAFEARLVASGPDEALVIVRDITGRKQMELALQNSRERYRIISELISDYAFAYRVEPDGTLLREWNTGGGARVTGLSLAELNRADSWNDLIHPDDLPGVLDQTEILLGGQPVTSEFRITPSQGEPRWLRRYMQPVWDDAEGRVVRIYGAVQDITERKQAEQQALELVLERERVAILANFLRDASHEFGNPLSVINTSLYLVAQIQDPQRRAHHLDMIYGQVSHIEKLIKGMLTMSRLDNPVDFLREPVDFEQVLEALRVTATERATPKNLAVQFTLDAPLPLLIGDSKYLHTALLNLLDNAITYTPQDGSIKVHAWSADNQIRIEIQDTGIGIPPEAHELIFTRFYRVDKARSHRGAGLGLPIAKKIIEAHDGRIEVESALGAGSTFRVILPLS